MSRRIDRLTTELSDSLCECGCGERTYISAYTCKRDGYVKGKARQYLPGHGTKHRFKCGFPEGVFVDDEDKHLSSLCKWWINHNGYVQGVIRDGGPRTFLHRVIVNCPDGLFVDHINGNPLDNRRNNLRVVSIAENNLNRSRAGRNSKSGHRNVYWKPDMKKWYVAFNIGSKKKIIGYYEKLDESISAADQYRKANGIPAW